MKKNIFAINLFFGIVCFSQTAESLNNARVSQQTYNSQASNYQREKALSQMEASAKASKSSEMKDLDEKFELNFLKKERLDSKFKVLNQKKTELQSLLLSSKNDAEKEKVNRKLQEIVVELDKNQQKLKENEAELKILQEKYNSLLEKQKTEQFALFFYLIDLMKASAFSFQSLFSRRIFTNAVPIIPPCDFSVTCSKSVLFLIPKPIITGFSRLMEANLFKYSSFFTSLFSFPVVDELETAYRNPELKESKYFMRSSEVSGVTKKVKFNPYFSKIGW